MKRILLLAIAMLMVSMAMAVPAHPGSAIVIQPDGTTLTIRLHGDEYLHFNTTDDGYSIVMRADGYYVYASKNADGELVPTEHVAHDIGSRSASEQAWLLGIKKYLTPEINERIAIEQQAEYGRRARARENAVKRAAEYDYNNFRGLILLVQFNDRSFSRSDYPDIANDIANKEGYKGYGQVGSGVFTGSVRDYFHDNSGGTFTPEFDVVGPITVGYSQYDGQKKANEIILEAIEAADSLVDFSLYDGDNDGGVDMVYFIFAGVGSNISGNPSGLVWPHTSFIYENKNGRYNYVIKDDVALGPYACSTELYGSVSQNIIDGIGVICHEFSHVLGLMDHYDTDYEGSGGQSDDPGEWDLMAGGAYQNNARTPSGYNFFEKWSVGFDVNLQTISEEGSYELEPLGGTSDTAYRIDTPVKKEFFIIENRQQTSKWDQYLPGHGMLVWHVDSTNSNVWTSNKVNQNPKHNYFILLRAGGTKGNTGASSDAFPGTKKVNILNNETQPANLLSWAGRLSPLAFENISENGNIISFDIIDANVLKTISLPEKLTIGKGLSMQLKEKRYPEMAPYSLVWSSSDEEVATVDKEGHVTALAVGEADICVVANDSPALTAICHLSVEEFTIVGSIAEYKAMEPEAQGALSLNNALVIFVNGKDAYVRDASGAIGFANTSLSLEVGDVLNGTVFGQMTVSDRVPLFMEVEGLTNDLCYTVSKGHEVEPVELAVEDISEANYCDLITLKEASLVSDGGIWAVGGSNQIRLWNTFKLPKISVPGKIDGKYFDITGIYQTNMQNGQVIDELALTGALKEVIPSGIASLLNGEDNADTHVSIYTIDGRKVADGTVNTLPTLPLKHGTYVVKAGNRTWQFVK